MLKLIVIAAFTVLSQADNCSPYIEFESPPYTCLYNVLYYTDSCEMPTFQACTVTKDGISTTYTSKQICSSFCCSQQSIVCPDQPTQGNPFLSSAFIAIILCSIAGLGAIIIFSYKYILEIKNFCGNFCQWIKGNSTQISPSDKVKKDDTMIELQINNNKEWKKSQEDINEKDCPICICDRINVKLDCGHFFHGRCIEECLKRKFECVLCRSIELHNLRFYCEQCLEYYIEAKMPELSQINECNSIRCLLCQMKQNIAIQEK